MILTQIPGRLQTTGAGNHLVKILLRLTVHRAVEPLRMAKGMTNALVRR